MKLLCSLLLLSHSSVAATGNTSALYEATVLAADHRGAGEGEQQVWRSHFVLEARGAAIAGPRRVTLAYPLPNNTRLEPQQGQAVTLVRDGKGAVIALDVDPRALGVPDRRARRLVWTFDATLASPARLQAGEVTLLPPLAQGGAGQRLTFDGGSELGFEPDAQHGLTRYLTHWATPHVSDVRIRKTERLLGERVGLPDPGAMYLTADAHIVDVKGLRGALVSHAQHRALVAVVAVLGSGVIVAGLLALYRFLALLAKREERQRHIESRYQKLNHELAQVDETLSKLET